jgi:hypothetical protein
MMSDGSAAQCGCDERYVGGEGSTQLQGTGQKLFGWFGGCLIRS